MKTRDKDSQETLKNMGNVVDVKMGEYKMKIRVLNIFADIEKDENLKSCRG